MKAKRKQFFQKVLFYVFVLSMLLGTISTVGVFGNSVIEAKAAIICPESIGIIRDNDDYDEVEIGIYAYSVRSIFCMHLCVGRVDGEVSLSRRRRYYRNKF